MHGRFVGGIEDRVLVPTDCTPQVSLRLDRARTLRAPLPAPTAGGADTGLYDEPCLPCARLQPMTRGQR